MKQLLVILLWLPFMWFSQASFAGACTVTLKADRQEGVSTWKWAVNQVAVKLYDVDGKRSIPIGLYCIDGLKEGESKTITEVNIPDCTAGKYIINISGDGIPDGSSCGTQTKIKTTEGMQYPFMYGSKCKAAFSAKTYSVYDGSDEFGKVETETECWNN